MILCLHLIITYRQYNIVTLKRNARKLSTTWTRESQISLRAEFAHPCCKRTINIHREQYDPFRRRSFWRQVMPLPIILTMVISPPSYFCAVILEQFQFGVNDFGFIYVGSVHFGAKTLWRRSLRRRRFGANFSPIFLGNVFALNFGTSLLVTCRFGSSVSENDFLASIFLAFSSL